jgi:hypothetical protein
MLPQANGRVYSALFWVSLLAPAVITGQAQFLGSSSFSSEITAIRIVPRQALQRPAGLT